MDKMDSRQICKTEDLSPASEHGAGLCQSDIYSLSLGYDDDYYDELAYALAPPSKYDNLLIGSRQEIMVYTVPSYPKNMNPLLPISLQKRLDGMSPKEFLKYVLTSLTLEERESLMVDERQRRKTFLVDWPHSNSRTLTGIKMAQSGFFAQGNGDRVQCVFCRGCLNNWEDDDNIMAEHARSFSFCRFVKGLPCGNREYKSSNLSNEDLTNVTIYPRRDGERGANNAGQDGEALGISTNRAALIQYAPTASRIRTFSRWPATAAVSAQRMCEAGFYFVGYDESVRCFYCGGGLSGWVGSDDPWVEHARWFPECAFLLFTKGESFIDEVHRTTPANKKASRKTIGQKKQEQETKECVAFQEQMVNICKRLGYSIQDIKEAEKRNGKPFSDIKELIDSIYELEDLRDDPECFSNRPALPSLPSTSTAAECPEEDRQAAAAAAQVPAPGVLDRNARPRKFEMGCRNCELKIDTFVPATHIGLPCAHLIFCDSCANESKVKALLPDACVKCPYYQCNGTLTGTMKIYFV